MTDSENSQVDNTYPPKYEESLPDSNLMWMLGLFIVGILLFVFADKIGFDMVNHPDGWSSNKAHEIALIVRSVGAMCILAGFVERIVIEIIKLRVAITKGKRQTKSSF